MSSEEDTITAAELIEQVRLLQPYSTIVVVRTFIGNKVGASISLPSLPGQEWQMVGDIDWHQPAFDRKWSQWIQPTLATIVAGAELPLKLDAWPKLLGDDGLPMRFDPNAPTVFVGSLTPAASGFVFMLVPKTNS